MWFDYGAVIDVLQELKLTGEMVKSISIIKNKMINMSPEPQSISLNNKSEEIGFRFRSLDQTDNCPI